MEEVLKQLVRIYSVSGSEKQIQSYIYNELKKYDQPKWIEGNIVLKISGIDQTKALIVNAHVDTVSPGEMTSWKYPPFGEGSGVIKNGKMFGLRTVGKLQKDNLLPIKISLFKYSKS